MTRRPLILAIAAVALPAPAAAGAQAIGPPGAAPGELPGVSAPEPTGVQPGRMRLVVASGLRRQGRRWVLRGQRVRIVGRVAPFVPGELVRVRIARGRRAVETTRRIRPARAGGGRFEVVFRPRRRARYRVTAAHAASGRQAPFTARAPAIVALRAVPLAPGARGRRVALLQQGLRALGFPTGSGGRFDDATARSVLAFRKSNRLGWSFGASRAVLRMVFAGRGRFRLRHPSAGRHVEADLSRQVLVLADRGRALRVYHTSSGAPATPTIRGMYRFYMKQPGTNAIGMVHSSYFIRGYAIHGFASVPLYPASHGCLRVPTANARSIFDWIRIGDRIFVYG